MLIYQSPWYVSTHTRTHVVSPGFIRRLLRLAPRCFHWSSRFSAERLVEHGTGRHGAHCVWLRGLGHPVLGDRRAERRRAGVRDQAQNSDRRSRLAPVEHVQQEVSQGAGERQQRTLLLGQGRLLVPIHPRLPKRPQLGPSGLLPREEPPAEGGWLFLAAGPG